VNPLLSCSDCRSIVIDYVFDTLKDQATIAYFFFDHQDPTTQDATMVVANLLYQVLASAGLSKWSVEVFQTLDRLFSNGVPTDICVLSGLMFECVHEYKSLVVVLDGLDECDDLQTRNQLIRFLVAIRHEAKVKAFVTSRHLPTEPISVLHNYMTMSIRAQEADIRLYVREKLRYTTIAQSVKEEIESILVSNADGT